jgi:hypothetical protein
MSKKKTYLITAVILILVVLLFKSIMPILKLALIIAAVYFVIKYLRSLFLKGKPPDK